MTKAKAVKDPRNQSHRGPEAEAEANQESVKKYPNNFEQSTDYRFSANSQIFCEPINFKNSKVLWTLISF